MNEVANEVQVELRINGAVHAVTCEVRHTLADVLRENLGLTGTHLGCEHGVCGACTIIVDGDTVRGCLMLAAQANGKEVMTIEGLADSGKSTALQAAFTKRNALQCGFCTPGMLASAIGYIDAGGDANREAIRQHISGNYCRCTGYQSIVDAICDVIEEART